MKIQSPKKIIKISILIVSILFLVSFFILSKEKSETDGVELYAPSTTGDSLKSISSTQGVSEGEYKWNYDFKRSYSSQSSGISFSYPEEYIIKEDKYELPDSITPSNLDKIDIFDESTHLVSIVSYKKEYFDNGGGMIEEENYSKIYQLPGNKYLYALGCSGCKTRFLTAYSSINNIGNKFYAHKHQIYENGREYKIISNDNLTVAQYNSVIGIISSINFSSVSTSNVVTKNSILNQTYNIPGTDIKVHLPTSILTKQNIIDNSVNLKFKNSDFDWFNEMNLFFKVLPYDSIPEPKSFLYTGGFDAINDVCLSDGKRIKPETFKGFTYCRAGGGDAGEGVSEILVLNKDKYTILIIGQRIGFESEYLYNIDIFKVMESIVWN